jgi:hypothetical protein
VVVSLTIDAAVPMKCFTVPNLGTVVDCFGAGSVVTVVVVV